MNTTSMLKNYLIQRKRVLLFLSLNFSLCVFVFFYRGPWWQPVRFHVGDFLIVQVLYFFLRLFLTKRSLAFGIVAIVAMTTECYQLLFSPAHKGLLTEITVGSTFDPVDLIAYLMGLLVALRLDLSYINSKQKTERKPLNSDPD